MQVYDDLDAHIIECGYDVRCMGFDPYNAKEFVERWQSENGPFGIEKVIQGAKTESVPLGELKLLSEQRMLLFDEALMTFAMGNCITLEDTNGNRKLYKRRHEQKIDAVAAMMDAEALVILSNIDGIYDGSPADPASQVIRRVAPGRDLSQYIDTARSSRGRGGMTTKSRISSRVAGEGIEVVIANGRRDGILTDLVLTGRDVVCTRFEAAPRPASGVKKWIASSEGFAKGALHLDAGAAAAISQSKAASILAVGVTAVEGEFERDDIVRILSPEGAPLGVGRISCDSATARRNLGRKGLKPLIHCDYLYLE